MNWVKKGLIYVPDGTSNDMNSHAAIPFADVLDNDTFRIYFSSRNIKGQSLPFYIDTDINDLSAIKKIQTEPIFSLGELGTFDDSGIMPSWITNYNSQKYMYYIAWNPQVTVSYRLSIGLAISNNNGETFTKFSNAPICDRNLHEPYFNTAPCVLLINGQWKMWYISCTKWQMINNYPEPSYHIKFAESKDGINWEKKGIVCIDYDKDAEAIGRPSVLYKDGKYKMWYSYRKIGGYRKDKNQSYKIGYAESNDGIVWNKDFKRPHIDVSTDGWDSEMITYSHVILHDHKLIMIYNGNGFGKSGFGYAVGEYE